MTTTQTLKSAQKSRAKRLADDRPALNRIANASDLSVVAVRELLRLEREPHNRHVRAVYASSVLAELSGGNVHADMVNA